MLGFIGRQFRRPSGFAGKIVSNLMKKGNKRAYDKMIPELEIKQNDHIFEIGYGHGLGVNRISSDYDCYLSGIDFSTLMYEEASKRNKKHIDNKKVDLHYGDFLQTEMNPEKYDKIFCINVIYFWDRLDVPFSKIISGLKKEGIFYMFMAHPNDLKKMKFTRDDIFSKYTIEKVVENLQSCGFKDITHKFERGYFIKCRK